MTLARSMFPPRADDEEACAARARAPAHSEYVRVTLPADQLSALRRLRKQAAAEVERLMAILDAIDGDSDFEPSGDELEPELGSIGGRRGFDQGSWSAGLDGEPSLASPEQHPNAVIDGFPFWDAPRRDLDGTQLAWATGSADDGEHEDAEEEHDGREPDVDDELSGDENEPWLGSFDRLVNQEHGWQQTAGGRSWLSHTNSDAEVQPY